VLFDLDGTLVDSFDDISDALNALLVEEGLRPVAREEARAMFGDGAQILVLWRGRFARQAATRPARPSSRRVTLPTTSRSPHVGHASIRG